MRLTDTAEFESGSLEFAESLSQPPFLGAVKDRRSKKEEEVFRMQAVGGGKRAYTTDPGVEVLNSNPDKFGMGLCTVDGSARTGKVFLVLSFEGKRSRAVNDPGGLSKMMRFQAVSAANFLARVEGRSWLADDAGNKYARPGVVAEAEKTQLAFEVSADAKGLAWHDGKEKAYALDPHPKEIRE